MFGGKENPTPDGTCIRDYIHVADVASAHLKSIDYLNNGHDNFISNLGCFNFLVHDFLL